MTRSALRIGVLGTRHVHALGMASELVAQGHEIVGAAEDDAVARSEWERTGLSPLMERDAVLSASDAVIVAGTNRERVSDTVAAIEAGVPVLAEKPVAISQDGVEQLQSAIRSHPTSKVSVALPLRFADAFARAGDAVRSGAIGVPLGARGTNHGQFPGGWFGSRAEAGGGALTDHVVHVADGLCWMLGERATSVYAVASSRMYDDLDVEDCGIVTLEFASGMFASVDASWSRPKSFPVWGDVYLVLVGSEGRMVIDPFAKRLNHYDDRVGKLTHMHYGDDMTAGLLRAFVDYVQDDGSCPVTLDEGLHASNIVLAAYRSVSSGRPEVVAELHG